MMWNPEQLLEDFLAVAKFAGIELQREAIQIETLPMPHRPPRSLPTGKTAVYVFSERDRVLKVGRVGPRSQARYTSQHYDPRSAPSTLARSLLKDGEVMQRCGLHDDNVSAWIRENTDRVNLILDADVGVRPLKLLEAFVQCRLQPVYEGPEAGPNG